jgi:hypothetical protein
MKLEWIVENNTKILYLDFREVEKIDDYLSLLRQFHELSLKRQGKFLALYNFLNVSLPVGVLEALASFAKKNNINPTKAAFIGLGQINEKLLQRLNGFLSENTERKLFQSEKEAIEWLLM